VQRRLEGYLESYLYQKTEQICMGISPAEKILCYSRIFGGIQLILHLGDHSFTAEKCHLEAFQEGLMKL